MRSLHRAKVTPVSVCVLRIKLCDNLTLGPAIRGLAYILKLTALDDLDRFAHDACHLDPIPTSIIPAKRR